MCVPDSQERMLKNAEEALKQAPECNGTNGVKEEKGAAIFQKLSPRQQKEAIKEFLRNAGVFGEKLPVENVEEFMAFLETLELFSDFLKGYKPCSDENTTHPKKDDGPTMEELICLEKPGFCEAQRNEEQKRAEEKKSNPHSNRC
ncbi:MAG: hypothetical protein AAGJ35_14760 [Myxococcota bacterium]